jgi:hypothetical protein
MPAAAFFREPFNPDARFVVVHQMKVSGRELTMGARFPKKAVSQRVLRKLFDSRRIGYEGETGRQRAKPPAPRSNMHRTTLDRPAPAVVATLPGEIPENWREFKARDLRTLLADLRPGMTFVNRIEMVDCIEAELAQRARLADGTA